MVNLRDPAAASIHLLVLERVDVSKNMARYYVLSIEATLFGNTALVREWGRMGARGRRRCEFFDECADARVALETWLTRKCKRGYVISHDACDHAP
jgi:predicted DNA-binding WGR domain protein